MRELLLPLRVYIEDTDAGGIVYYVNYLKYMERARTEFMRSMGYDKTAIFSDRLMFVVHSVNIIYSSPARLDDEIAATAKITKLARTNILFEQKVMREGIALCHAGIRIACVDRDSLRPKAMPELMMQKLRELIA